VFNRGLDELVATVQAASEKRATVPVESVQVLFSYPVTFVGFVTSNTGEHTPVNTPTDANTSPEQSAVEY